MFTSSRQAAARRKEAEEPSDEMEDEDWEKRRWKTNGVTYN